MINPGSEHCPSVPALPSSAPAPPSAGLARRCLTATARIITPNGWSQHLPNGEKIKAERSFLTPASSSQGDAGQPRMLKGVWRPQIL